MTDRFYPAIRIVLAEPGDAALDRVLAALDDFSPTSIDQPHEDSARVFFAEDAARDRALACVRARPEVAAAEPLMVSDESWAERSQASLHPIRAGRLIIAPPWSEVGPASPDDLLITIQPSMGFGTGHHASTRLCLRLLQEVDFSGKSMLDIGTGSGVLALAAWRLGARDVLAVDFDPDAIESASENLERNGASSAVILRYLDVRAGAIDARYDVVAANLTGETIARQAEALSERLAPEGTLIVSGVLVSEAASVTDALARAGLRVVTYLSEDEWMGARLRRDR